MSFVDLMFVYIILLLIWLVINVVFYALSLVSKKAVFAIPFGLNAVVNYIIQIYFLIIYPLYLIWQIIVAKAWLFLILFFFLGSLIIGFYQMIVSFLITPFGFITYYFSEKSAHKMDEAEQDKDVVAGEILDEKGKVIGTTEPDSMISVRMAKYFLGVYFMGVGYLVLFPVEREGIIWWGYITKPFVQIITYTLFVGGFYIIFHKLKYKSFFPKDKRLFYIRVWKTTLFIFIPLGVLLYFLALLTNTL